MAVIKRYRSHPEKQDQPSTFHAGTTAASTPIASAAHYRLPHYARTQTNQNIFLGKRQDFSSQRSRRYLHSQRFNGGGVVEWAVLADFLAATLVVHLFGIFLKIQRPAQLSRWPFRGHRSHLLLTAETVDRNADSTATTLRKEHANRKARGFLGIFQKTTTLLFPKERGKLKIDSVFDTHFDSPGQIWTPQHIAVQTCYRNRSKIDIKIHPKTIERAIVTLFSWIAANNHRKPQATVGPVGIEWKYAIFQSTTGLPALLPPARNPPLQQQADRLAQQHMAAALPRSHTVKTLDQKLLLIVLYSF